ncbi:PREDICTED: matrix metalloproteinase-17-like [Branchiostoma belcheri]|uniref:Matrix metalloproteinase-17-like n=1 Tax=Branchiostoma belcheri TaxID=7741 RepID=A0A6P4XC81_BRABE|nr:PREDICTED: matrix metalloproteinase-17-like [Branchiostoma belcheri]
MQVSGGQAVAGWVLVGWLAAVAAAVDPEFLSRRPRCGVSDAEDGRTSHVRWGRTDLTYKISYYTADLTREEVDIAIADAFRLWESVSALRFTRVFGHADIDVSFVYGDHFGDERPFDGPSTPSGGGSLAHAFPPDSGSDFAGDVHFDDSEDWTMDKREGINLYQMAVHEIGHSLGLSHSHQHTSVMYPYYLGLRRHFRLHKDDIRDIQRLYGPPRAETVDNVVRSGSTSGHRSAYTPLSCQCPLLGVPDLPRDSPGIHETPGMPQICTAATHIDTIARMGTETWVFKNRYFWRGPDGKNGPYVISDYWRGLSDHTNHIDAIYQRETDQKVIIFQGRHYYVFHVNKLESGPHRIVDLGLPNYVDAVLPWEGHTYFFRGRRYWLYDEKERRLDSRTPKPIRRMWKGLPWDGVDAAIRHDDGALYFFNGDQVYRLDERELEVMQGYPRVAATDYFRCPPPVTRDHRPQFRFPAP